MEKSGAIEAEELVHRAEALAKKLYHPYLGVEHVFLAAIHEGLLSQTLQTAQIDASALEEQLKIVPSSEKESPKKELSRTPRLKRVLERSAEIALEKFRRGLLAKDIVESLLQEENGLVPLALRNLGSSISQLRGGSTHPSSPIAEKHSETKKRKTPLLDKLGRELTRLAKEKKLDPVIGRTEELKRMMQILTRKKKNVPILIGEPGVGKTAVVYALAHRLAERNVPQALQGKRVIELPLGSLLAGTAHRGELEERTQKLIEEASQDPDCILFIDEIHSLIGAGNLKGGLDLANLLKPALADGALRVIGATTTEEYQKYLIHDQALERRMQPVLVSEPSEENTLKILSGVKETYEKHHGVIFEDEAIRQAVILSLRYLPDRRLPDKALDLLDEAASRVKIKTGVGLSPKVGPEEIAEVLSLWTGIPIQKLSQNEKAKLLGLEASLKSKVIAQDEAVKKVSETIRVSRVGLGNPKRPIGVFLFLGPTGVGKTELAKALADAIYGNPEAMIRLDMSEYKEPHTASKLIGSPPGYVGYEEEGQLTRAVRAKPYSLILLDEIEKAHAEVLDLFLQVFDDGRLTDAKGRTVYFNNSLIIMTSNLGSRQILEKSGENLRDQVLREIRNFFRPEFLNRIDEVIIFNRLDEKALEKIIALQLQELKNRLSQQKLQLLITPPAILFLKEKGYEPMYGARPLRRAIQQYLAKPLAKAILAGNFPEGSRITADLENGEIAFAKAE